MDARLVDFGLVLKVVFNFTFKLRLVQKEFIFLEMGAQILTFMIFLATFFFQFF